MGKKFRRQAAERQASAPQLLQVEHGAAEQQPNVSENVETQVADQDSTDLIDHVQSDEDRDQESDHADVFIENDEAVLQASSDPSTVASTLVKLGRLYNDAGEISSALSRHLTEVAGEPELHSFLQRMQTVIGDFRHAVTQTEAAVSDRMREGIEQALLS